MAVHWEIGWTALALLQLAGSIAVTVHVLLRRPAPVSAAAWIGLAWLAPGIGALLYVLLGVNRIERRGQRLRRRQFAAPDQPACSAIAPPHLMPLERAATRITGRPLLAGNAVEPLPHGDAAYPAMLEAIEHARASIALSSYIFRNDRTGRIFIAALAAAQARGVAVRVLVDGVGGGWFNSGAYHRLRRLGVPAARFLHSHLPWRMPLANLRSHKKLLVVDGTVGFTGGLNIGDENLEMPAAPLRPRLGLKRLLIGPRRRGIRDMHFRFDGPVVAQMMAAFAEDWAFAAGETLVGPAWFPPVPPAGDVFARVATSGPDHDMERIKLLKMSALAAAQRRVRIVTPYFLPDDALASALALAALRGVRVEIVVSMRSDHLVLDWAMRDGLLAMIRAGCQVLWSAPPFNHAKMMTVDDAWCLIGSANWDMRSLRLNFELNVALLDPALAARIDALIDETPTRPATMRELIARPVAVRLRDAACRLLLPYL
jgi:cardiolipin synthase